MTVFKSPPSVRSLVLQTFLGTVLTLMALADVSMDLYVASTTPKDFAFAKTYITWRTVGPYFVSSPLVMGL